MGKTLLVLLALIMALEGGLLAVLLLRYRRVVCSEREVGWGILGAATFLVGVAYTNLQVALHVGVLFQHTTLGIHQIVGRIPQVVGGIVTLHIVRRHLDVRVVSKRRVQEEVSKRELEAGLAETRRMESLGRMARGIIHDFNHIIAVVKGYTTFIKRDLAALDGTIDKREALEESVSVVRAAIDQAEGLSRQLAEFSRLGGSTDARITPNTVVREVESTLRFPTVGIKLDLRLDDDAIVIMPPTSLRQVLLNLALNARDAMPKGGDLRIQTFEAGRCACIRFTDTGVGMDAETREHVFEPFFTTKAKGEGTGLGLSTVYGIVQKADGSVRVSSDPGHGTDILVTLPLATPAASPSGPGRSSSCASRR